jgi:NADH:ubiquinone oxidoreductase subunit 5 (subunit L)/multisubunit Na+/H+ antiporter MnhA subunit
LSVYDVFLILGVLFPLLVGTFLFLFGWVFGRQRLIYKGFVLVMALVTLLFQLGLAYGFGNGARTPDVNLFTWSPVPEFGVNMALRADLLAFFFAFPLGLLSFLLIIYLLLRRPDPEHNENIEYGRLYGLLFLVEGAGLAAFYSVDLVMFFFWLEALGFFFYLLAGPGLHGASSDKSAYQSYCASIFAGFAILAPLLVIISRNGGTARYDQLSPATVDSLLFLFIVTGLLVKAAQFPFQIIFGEQKNLPSAAHALVGAGALMPLAVYLPARLQTVTADRVDLFGSLGWLYLLMGALTIFTCGWLALRESSQVRRSAFMVGGGFGFVAMALGLGDLPAAMLQLLGLTIGAPLLFLCADLLQIETAPAPPDPANAAKSIPIKRPALFRPLLAAFYIVGAAGLIGLPLSPAYAGRWQTLGETLGAGYRFYFGLAVAGLALMGLAMAYAFILLLQEPHHTEDKPSGASWWPITVPALLALVSAGLSVAPNLTTDWLTSFTSRVPLNGLQRLPNALFAPGSLFALLLLLGLLVGAAVIWKAGRAEPIAAFNGGMLFGHEAETERKMQLSRSKAIVLVEEEDAFGFEDEFFKVGLSHKYAPPPPKLEPRLSSKEYFGPLLERLREPYKLLDTSYGGGLFSRILLAIVNFIRRALEWLTERFYPALAAFILLIFIFLLTR